MRALAADWFCRKQDLNRRRAPVTSRPMKLILVLLVWFVMAAVLAVGIVKAVTGSVVLLVAGLLAFFILFGWIGCSSH